MLVKLRWNNTRNKTSFCGNHRFLATIDRRLGHFFSLLLFSAASVLPIERRWGDADIFFLNTDLTGFFYGRSTVTRATHLYSSRYQCCPRTGKGSRQYCLEPVLLQELLERSWTPDYILKFYSRRLSPDWIFCGGTRGTKSVFVPLNGLLSKVKELHLPDLSITTAIANL